MQGFFKRNTCRLCKSQNLEFIICLGSTPIGDDFIPSDRLDKIQNEYPLELNFCRDCGLFQLVGVINPELIYREYMYETCISLGLKAHFQDYVNEVMRRISPKKESLVIDIGCNDGTLLKFFKDYNMRVLGVEPAYKIAQRVAESGIETIPNFFTADLARKIKKERGNATMITANNIFANVDDLDDFITGVKELMTLDSVFIFETGYMVDLVQNTVIDNIYHEHLCYFSIKPLVKFFKKHGLEMIDVDRVPTKGGSIRCAVQLSGGARSVLPSVSGLITLETELGFDRSTPFKIFVDRVESMKAQLRGKLLDLKARGKTIAGYGASVGVTTLLYYLDLKDILSFLIDDNETKYSSYSPGLHIPVFPSKAIYEKMPDYVLILAWRYADPIIKKHQKYLEQNGRFILPLPGVEVIEKVEDFVFKG